MHGIFAGFLLLKKYIVITTVRITGTIKSRGTFRSDLPLEMEAVSSGLVERVVPGSCGIKAEAFKAAERSSFIILAGCRAGAVVFATLLIDWIWFQLLLNFTV